MAKSIDDIFNDDEFGLLDFRENNSVIKTDEDRLIDSFQEINIFFEKNHREPSSSSMSEYGLLSKLKAFRANEDHKKVIKAFDKYNLLGDIEIVNITIDDILNDDELGILDSDADTSIFEFKHTPRPDERASTDFVAQRRPVVEKDFAKYDEMFRQVHKDLKEGKRKLVKFENAETNLIEGKFYLVDGLIAYLETSNAEKILKENSSGDRVRLEGRTVTVFENGTKSNMLFRSLGKAIHKNGKIITDTQDQLEDELFKNAGVISEEDRKSGWIYVLKSKSNHPEIKSLKDLYKIGFSISKIEDRIKNASNEATYLYADVEIVATYKCYNLNVKNFENLLHKFFGESCLNVEIDVLGKPKAFPREWFIAPFSIIDETVDLIISGGIVNFKYNAKEKSIELKHLS